MDATQEPKRKGVVLYRCDKQGINEGICASFAQLGIILGKGLPSSSGKPEVHLGLVKYIGPKEIGELLTNLRH